MTTPSVTEDLVMSTGEEGLGEHTRGPATSEGEDFCPILMRSKTKASKMKACALRRYRRRRPMHQEGPKGLHAEKNGQTMS